MAPIHDNHSDVYLTTGCGIGGLKAAGSVVGHEMVTREPFGKSKVLYKTATNIIDDRTVDFLCRKCTLRAGADASEVAKMCLKQHGWSTTSQIAGCCCISRDAQKVP